MYIYSCSSDKRCYLSEINYQSTAVEIAYSDYGYTALEYDKVNSRLFLTLLLGLIRQIQLEVYMLIIRNCIYLQRQIKEVYRC